MKELSFRLCYIFTYENIAVFCNKSPSSVWGDDWDDAPFEHNAGPPVPKEGQEFVSVRFESRLQTPDKKGLSASVQDINKGWFPWLEGSGYTIGAGCTLWQFREIIGKTGGRVYPHSRESFSRDLSGVEWDPEDEVEVDVHWSMPIPVPRDATPVEIAMYARSILLDPNNIASIFKVRLPHGDVQVDALEGVVITETY